MLRLGKVSASRGQGGRYNGWCWLLKLHPDAGQDPTHVLGTREPRSNLILQVSLPSSLLSPSVKKIWARCTGMSRQKNLL